MNGVAEITVATSTRFDPCFQAPRSNSVGRALPLTLVPLLLLLSSAVIAESGPQWTSGGPPSNSRVSQIAVDPQSPQNLYAIANLKIFKSTDGGRNWNLLASQDAVTLAVDPRRPMRVFIGTVDGVLVSTDGGASWTSAGLAFVQSIWIDPSRPDTVYASRANILPQGYYRTVDGGSNWSPLNFPISGRDVAAFTVGPDGTVFIGSTSGAIFLSRDGGESWTAASSSPSLPSPGSLLVDPVTPTTLYASTSSGLFRSVDSGASWERRGNGSPSSLAIDPTNPAVLYAGALGGGLWKTVDAGQTWKQLGVGAPFVAGSAVIALAIDPQSPMTVYSGTASQGLFRSDDGGATWVRSDEGLPGPLVGALAVDPMSLAIVYAGGGGSVGSVVYQSLDAGASWKETGAVGLDSVRVLAINPLMPTTLYAGTAGNIRGFPIGGKILRSTDGGVSWSAVFSAPIASLAIDPHNPDTLYAGVACVNGLGCINLKSTDGGVTWVILEGLPQGFPRGAQFFLDRSGVIYAISHPGPASARIFKSTDGAASWSTIDVGVPLIGLAIDASSPPRFYATTATGLFKSTDGGNSWSETGLSLPASDLAIDPQDPDALYAATSGSGVFRSLDGGSTWKAINSGLPSLSVFKIVIDSAGAYLHAATFAGGVHNLQLPMRIHRVGPPRGTRAVKPRS